jgi:hypothetical protein
MHKYTLLENSTFEGLFDWVSFYTTRLEKAKLIRQGVKEDSIKIIRWTSEPKIHKKIPNNTHIVVCGFDLPLSQMVDIQENSLSVKIA